MRFGGFVLGCRVWGLGLGFQGLGFGVRVLGLRVWVFGFGVWFGAWGLGYPGVDAHAGIDVFLLLCLLAHP